LAQVPEGRGVKNSHPHNTPTSLSAAEDYMKVVTELMAGLGIPLSCFKFNSLFRCSETAA